MDLLSSIHKSGSRGGVNFSWDEVQTSQHRENYLGHSLMAPVGRWQKNRDLSWYAKGNSEAKNGETEEEKKIRERKEEIKRIKEAEADALARALGLPVAERGVGEGGTGANNIPIAADLKKAIKEAEDGDEEIAEVGRGTGFGDFVGRIGQEGNLVEGRVEEDVKGGLIRKGSERKERRDERSRSRSRSRERRHRRHREGSRERHRHRDRSGDRHRHRHRRGDRDDRRDRSRSRERRERRYRSRSRSPGRRVAAWDDREPRRDANRRPRRSRSPDVRDRGDRRERRKD